MRSALTHQRRQSWLIRVYFFLFLGGFSFLTPFLNLFYRRQGLSGTQIGLLGTVGAVVGLVAAPLWGRWSDRLSRPQRLLQAAFGGSALAYLLLSRQDVFIWMAILIALIAVLLSGVDPVSDSIALRFGQGNAGLGKPSPYGSIRLWGSLGWALVVTIAGWTIETFGIQSAFLGYALFAVSIILVLAFFHLPPPAGGERARSGPGTSLGAVIRLLGKDKAFLGLALSLGFLWVARMGLHQFQAIYMDELGAGETVIGLVSTLGALIEIPAMLWADRLVAQFGSHRVIQAAFLIFAINAAAILGVPQIPTFVLVGALGGLGFSLFNVALVVFMDERAPLGQTATVLALFTSTLRGLTQILAAPLNGLAYDHFGAYPLYGVALVGSLLGWLTFRAFVSGLRTKSNI